MAPNIPAFTHTPVEAIPTIVDRVRSTFFAHKTKPIEYRLVQLRKLYWGIKDNEDAIVEACRLDLGKPVFEAFLAEVGWVENDIVFTCNNLEKWAKDEKAPDIALMNAAVSPKIRSEPLGCVLVIGAYNFPVQLSLGPLIGAMAAGCTAVLKPSEGAPHTAAVLQKIIEDCLDPASYAVIQGAIPETTALLHQKWDKIFYTGNANVGTIIAKKAAETLTPVALELGGRNPAIITKNADARLAAKRLLWGKIMNAGQICLSQNYILVDNEVLPQVIEQMKVSMKEFFPNGVRHSEDYARIVSDRHFQRLKAMLDNTNGKILMGGTMDADDKFIEPTVVLVDDINDSLIKEESFGPFIPIIGVKDLDEAIRLANQVQSTPLATYPFGKKAETDRILRETRSGGASVNDAFFHGSIPTLSFGGVGESGTGAYRGKASFDCFTHKRSVTTTPSWAEALIAIRYPPYTGKLNRFKKMSSLTANFDREGRAKTSILGWLMSLGSLGGEGSGVLIRWFVVAVAAAGVRQYMDRRSKL
ncbi:MAG: hypothetical protein M1817_002309 [Caeruleum heppii]|nr:MAG: hypothetical protein M1817_003506 [Caeruleum heppii]KAI9673671.1 MAG: hypothetical protein M1817_002309 [Caeruleum heppii]